MVWPGLASYTTSKNVDYRLVRNQNNPKSTNDSRLRIFGHKGTSNTKLSPPFFTEAQLTSVFRRFDGNRDGRLSRQELRSAFNSLGSRFPTYRAFAALHQADQNGDGYISEDEMDDLIHYALSCGYHVQ
ncbi:PREDICTED: probable calcium-binding protein CML10 [Theobroma cacao]|uniref:Probable calcium-binding protein CML10 n=1 Tax=Theobroma cacao TaxID=3641 RepID=A0AB32V5Z7_THECC|nr:PREDICTED: probable calcium-binding protein CML10 [Theobroma cacao]